MPRLSAAADLARRMLGVTNRHALEDSMTEICELLGARYFAVSHHVDFAAVPKALRMHNYPGGWQDWYDAQSLGLSDPIHRASHRTASAFFWSEVGDIIPMSPCDEELLGLGKQIGLGEGITIPVHIPGEARGSVSFVAEVGSRLHDELIICAHAIGVRAFEGMRRLERDFDPKRRPPISLRQRQCIALAGRGMSNRAIAIKLGISEQTVMEYLREARGRLGVHTRTELVVDLLDGGELCFTDCRDLLY
ncbi:LuxR family transcriptional regulator [Novosphingobium sp. PS1R-30]|uniref:LuxR family transcriptional regulator n=1 Tax=Novosphingobium anseongense TaxID=3133436 RepID=A0ABU8S1L8_9SPHN